MAKLPEGHAIQKQYVLETEEDIRAMRADAEFADGAIALLSYREGVAPQAWISYDNPKYFGQAAHIGDTVSKDEAGNFFVN